MKVIKPLLSLAVTALTLPLGATAAQAQIPSAVANYPERPIKLVVGYEAGGGNDIAARMIAKEMAQILHQPVVVENRPGAGTNIGASYVARSAPDGYTLSLSSAALAINVSLYPKLDYDAVKDFAPIAVFAEAPNLLIINPKLPINSVADLVAYAKKNPDKSNFSSSGIGSSQHLAGELLKDKAGINITHIPYKGSAPSLAAVVSGEADFTFVNIPSSRQLIDSGKVKALAITSDKRFPSVPNIPTMAEAGVPGVVASTWYSILAPAGTPKPIIDKLNRVVNQAVAKPAFRKTLEDMGTAPMSGSPEYFQAFLADEIVRWRKIVRDSHASAQ
jgi:tripartite-type tricarboxylate transporter receptor subunit TctC